MKKTVKLFSAVLAVLTLVTMLITPASAYADPTVAIQSNNATVTTGGTVVITVRYSVSDTDIGALLGHLEYDETVFEPVAGSSTGEIQFGSGGAGGKITVQYDADGSGKKSVSGSVTFKAKKVGSASFGVVTNEFYNFSIEQLTTPAKKTTTVNVQNVQLSSNNNLKSVSISPGGTSGRATITPAFSSAVTNYTVKVPHDTKNVNIDAVVAELGKATYSLEGPWAAPASGDWIRKIIVTAENGSKKTYTFKFVKDAAPTPTPTPTPDPEPTPDPDPKPNEDLRVIVGNKEYFVVTDFSGIETPAGFEQNISRYNNIEVPCYTIKDGTIECLLLEDAEGNKELFKFNKSNIEFIPFEWIELDAGKYVFANAAEYTNIVSELESTDIKIGGETVVGYKLNSSSDFVLVWAISTDGIGKLYVYDTVGKTMQRYADIHQNDLLESGLQGYNPEPLKKTVNLYLALGVGAVMLLIILVFIVAWLSALGKLKRVAIARKEFDFVPFIEENPTVTDFYTEQEAPADGEQETEE